MTGLGVERMPRTACPLPSGSATGFPVPLPPFSQKAERPAEPRARRTGLRWGLRVLVVGGLAGAAWLLTGAAAQAADRADGPVGSLLGSVVGSDATAPVTGLLEAAAQPLETGRPAHHKRTVVTDVVDTGRRVLTRPARTLDEVVHGPSGTAVDAAVGGVDQVLREVVGPTRPTGGATATRRLTAVPDPATASAHPAGERPHQPAVAPAPATAEPGPVPATSRTTIAAAASRGTIDAADDGGAIDVAADRGRFDAAATRRDTVGAARKAPARPVRHDRADTHASALRHHASRPTTAGAETTADDSTTDGDGPAAPLRLHLGAASGAPTSGSGAPTEGGSAAFLPAAIASSTMASQRLLIASDVEVRRYDAEAPTVSPD